MGVESACDANNRGGFEKLISQGATEPISFELYYGQYGWPRSFMYLQEGSGYAFLDFLRSWYLCYFSPDAARRMQTAAPQAYLDRIGSNINNVAQYMYRENKRELKKYYRIYRQNSRELKKSNPRNLKMAR